MHENIFGACSPGTVLLSPFANSEQVKMAVFVLFTEVVKFYI